MDGILLAALGAGAIGLMLYLLLVVWPVRVKRRLKEQKPEPEAVTDERMARALEAAARIAGKPPQSTSAQVQAPASAPAPTTPQPMVLPPPVATPSLASIAEVLDGIRLPHELAPLTTMAPRTGAGDRVAFWTDTALAEVIGPAFVEELRRIGCTVTQIDPTSYAVLRDDTRAMVALHESGQSARIEDAPAFPTVPPSVVVEIWLPV